MFMLRRLVLAPLSVGKTGVLFFRIPKHLAGFEGMPSIKRHQNDQSSKLVNLQGYDSNI